MYYIPSKLIRNSIILKISLDNWFCAQFNELGNLILNNHFQMYEEFLKFTVLFSNSHISQSTIRKYRQLVRFCSINQLHIYLFKVNNIKARIMCDKSILKTLQRYHWRHAGTFIVAFKQTSRIILVFLLLTLDKKMPAVYRVLGYWAFFVRTKQCFRFYLFKIR